MRTEKELWELVLSRTDLFETGLCGWANELWAKDLVTDEEFLLLKSELKDNLPEKKYGLLEMFCWPPFKIAPRIEWIKNRIKQLENGEL